MEVKVPVAQTPPAPRANIQIDHVIGPRQIHAGEEFTLRVAVSGTGTPTGYVWRFKLGDTLFERRTAEPRVTAGFGRTGEALITCEVLGDGGAVAASQQIKVAVVPTPVVINAGGPYAATLNRPARFLGNARARSGQIARYEWNFTGGERPDWTAAENAVAQHTFTSAGQHLAVFTVRLPDGSAVSDTAAVNVTAQLPTANAGGDIVSSAGRRVHLNGTGTSPESRIVRYEWDFDGDGVFDWISETTGVTERVFRTFTRAALRVTDAEGNTAVDTMRVVICPSDMVTVAGGKFCIDRFEWPNRRGALPQTNVSWHEANAACAAAGKRLCTASEWSRACRNDDNRKPAAGVSYPYGFEFDERRCNTVGNQRGRNALAPAGALADCAGALGIHDMSGNAAEWVASGDAQRAQAFGGFYQSEPEHSGCESNATLEKGRRYVYVGFRCCK
jgi:hypothetical protein